MTFNLDNRHFFLQINHGNSDGIFKFKPFGTCSMTFWFHELITFSIVFLVEPSSLGSRSRLFFLILDIFFLHPWLFWSMVVLFHIATILFFIQH